MEPITIISYTLTTFFAYYIGADFGNYIKYSREIEEIKGRLDRIHNSINNITSR